MIQNTTISLVDELVVPVDVDFTALMKMAVERFASAAALFTDWRRRLHAFDAHSALPLCSYGKAVG
jgi:hypothetical protein